MCKAGDAVTGRGNTAWLLTQITIHAVIYMQPLLMSKMLSAKLVNGTPSPLILSIK